MLANTIVKTENVWKKLQESGHATYIPSALLLLMAMDNGWEVVKAELVPSWDQLGFFYLVSLERCSDGQAQELIIPKSALVEKILEQHGTRSSLIPIG